MVEELKLLIDEYELEVHGEIGLNNALQVLCREAFIKGVEASQKKAHNSDYAKLPTRDDIIAHLKDRHKVKHIRCDVIDSTLEIIRKLGNFV